MIFGGVLVLVIVVVLLEHVWGGSGGGVERGCGCVVANRGWVEVVGVWVGGGRGWGVLGVETPLAGG